MSTARTGGCVTVVKSAAREGVRTIIQVGDFGLDWPGAMRGRLEDRLNRLLIDHDMKLICSPGNHDNLTRISQLDVQDDGLIHWRFNITVLPKGGRTVIEGLRIGGLGGAMSVDKAHRREGRDWWPDEAPTREQAEHLVAGGPIDVLVTHDAAWGVPVRSSGSPGGSRRGGKSDQDPSEGGRRSSGAPSCSLRSLAPKGYP